MAELWRIEMLGGLRAVHPDRVVTRFRSQKAGSLLAYLAFYSNRAHSREQLIEILWPEDELDSARNKLRIALHSLRHQLEPPGVAPGAVLTASRLSVQLNSAAVSTDVAQFEGALRSADQSSGPERRAWLTRAMELYRGPLLPTCFEMWVMPEQQRLSGLFFQAIAQLVQELEEAGDLRQGLDYAGRAVAADPLREEGQREFIRLLDRVGQPTAALQQYRQMERLLWEELEEKPSAATSRLIALIEQRAAGQEGASPRPAQSSSPPASSVGYQSPPVKTSGLQQQTQSSPKAEAEWTHPLPLQLTRFFGREQELEQLHHLLLSPETRLVTLTGPGGSGKTRLAIETARGLLEAKQCAIWWVPLVDLADPRLIGEAVRQAMQLPRSPQTPALEQVLEALSERDQPTLLVLDNFEHLVEGGAELVQALLERVTTLQCLVTSRQLLNLGGEREFPVEPLPVPEPSRDREGAVAAGPLPHGRGSALAALAQCASVRLFVDRAQVVRPAFQVTDRNAAVVAELCRRLEGIPLAIELAAAHARLLAPARMLSMLARRFDFLSTRRRDLPARHRTLRAAIEGSVQLLSPERQRFFARLCLFRGGWSLEAAAAVCLDGGLRVVRSADDTDDAEKRNCLSLPSAEIGEICGSGHPLSAIQNALDALTELRESSLVQAEANDAETRYQMLETLREYAAEQLGAEERAAAAEPHARYFMALAEEAEPYIGLAPEREVWLARLRQEHGNIRAAIEWCIETGEAEVGMRLAGALRHFWWWLGYFSEARQHLERLLALPGATGRTAARGKALLAAAQVGITRSGNVGLLEESLEIHRELGDRKRVAVALRGLAGGAIGRGDYPAAQALYEEDLAISRELGDRENVAGTIGNLSSLAALQGNYAEAWRLLEEGAALRREIGLRVPVWNAVSLHIRQGNLTTARSLIEEQLAHDREGCLQNLTARPLYLLAVVSMRQGDPAAARALLEEDLPICRKSGRRGQLAESLELFAAVTAAEGAADRAARLLGAAEALREVLSFWHAPADRGAYEEVVATIRVPLSEEALASAWAEGRLLSPDQAFALALEAAACS